MEELADQLEAPFTPEQTAALSPLVSLPMGCILLWLYIAVGACCAGVCPCFFCLFFSSSASSAGMIGQKGNKER